MPSGSSLRLAQTEDLPAVAALLREYAAEIREPNYFRGFEEEIRGLPGEYAPPGGRLWILKDDDGALGCVAYRPWQTSPALRVAELKRLFVRPRGRGFGFGRRLLAAAMEQAGRDGYQAVRWDTLDVMTEAREMYRRLGFREIAGPDGSGDLRLSYWQHNIDRPRTT